MSAVSRSAGTGEDSSFQRRNRAQGSSNRSYSDNVSAPAHAVKARRETLIVTLIGIVFPPVAIGYYWYAGRFEFRLRIVITALLVMLMTLYFSWLMPVSEPEPYQPTIVKPQAVESLVTPSENG